MQIPTLINRGRNGFNMTPMIDVVFLLIIFFLVASHLSDQETHVKVDLPTALSGQPQSGRDSNRITLHVPREKTVLIAGREVPFSGIFEKISELVAFHGADIELRIRGNRSVSWQTLSPILKACADAGVWNVTFAVYGRDP